MSKNRNARKVEGKWKFSPPLTTLRLYQSPTNPSYYRCLAEAPVVEWLADLASVPAAKDATELPYCQIHAANIGSLAALMPPGFKLTLVNQE